MTDAREQKTTGLGIFKVTEREPRLYKTSGLNRTIQVTECFCCGSILNTHVEIAIATDRGDVLCHSCFEKVLEMDQDKD